MKCPFCSHLESKVIDSRVATAGDVIRRRRECEGCARRFTSRERVEDVLPVVVKKDGTRVPFDREKVLHGVRLACNKRPVAMDKLEKQTPVTLDDTYFGPVIGSGTLSPAHPPVPAPAK